MNAAQLLFKDVYRRLTKHNCARTFYSSTNIVLLNPHLKTHTCFGGLATGKIATCFRRCRWVVDYKVIARVSISSNLMSSKNLTSSNNAANQINLNYSIDSTEVESLLGKTFEMRRQPLQCICVLQYSTGYPVPIIAEAGQAQTNACLGQKFQVEVGSLFSKCFFFLQIWVFQFGPLPGTSDAEQ